EMGAAAVAHAPADGYTILLGNSSVMVINPLAGGHASYDPVGSFDAVSLLGRIAQAIVVNPSVPANNLQELASYAKRHPDKLSYGTPGVGSLNHLTGELFKLLVDSPGIVHVPYRGAGPAIADVIAGQIPMAIPAVNGQLLQFHRGGRLRILAVTSPERLRAAPDLPTAREAGMPNLVVQGANWLCVPRGTPAAVIARISEATGRALADPDLQRIYLTSGIEPASDSSPQGAAQFLQSEIARWKPIVQRIGLKLD
ncbi:MAG TPA: tripartite tricarboxylate transporter substrate-binding protein, partial [Xanthobacteraceae bacterium]|nr:tripartite tricarboxylate transporter substrate-binding protein [Xanthobacteraceae bacterium]